MGHTSVSRGVSGTDLVRCVTSLDTVVGQGCLERVQMRPDIRVTRPRLTFRKPQGTVPQDLTLLGGARFIAWHLRRPSLGECRRDSRNFREFWACLGNVLVLYTSHRPTQNIIKDNERNSMNKRNILLYKNISHSFYSRKGHTVCCKFERERWRDIYLERGLLLAPYLLPGARGYQRLHPLASRIVRDDLMPLIGCVSIARLPILTRLTV